MLSRAQEARVRDVLANHLPGTIQTYCLEHLAAVAKIDPPLSTPPTSMLSHKGF
jgi:hypothetical protein